MIHHSPKGHRRRGGAPAEGTGVSPKLMARLAAALFLVSFAFGGLPQSAAVRERLARAGLVSSERADTQPETTPTTLPPPVVPSDVVAMLASSGYPDISASELDRVVTLRGTVPDEASRRVILRLVGDLAGVNDVIDETVVAAPGATGDVVITGNTSQVTLTGSLPDAETASAVLEAIQAVYVADQVDGAITVDPEVAVPARVAVAIESTRPEIGERLRAEFDELDQQRVRVDFRFRQLEIPRIESDLGELLAAEPIEFAIGSSQVDDSSQATLDKVAALLDAFPTAVVEVGGHTDDTGSDRANRQLGAERAAAVIAELLDRGVSVDLVPVGYGETRPRIVPFDTDAARAANRRIEFVLVSS